MSVAWEADSGSDRQQSVLKPQMSALGGAAAAGTGSQELARASSNDELVGAGAARQSSGEAQQSAPLIGADGKSNDVELAEAKRADGAAGAGGGGGGGGGGEAAGALSPPAPSPLPGTRPADWRARLVSWLYKMLVFYRYMVQFVLHRMLFRYWVKYCFLVYLVLTVMLVIAFVIQPLFLVSDKARRKLEEYDLLAVGAVTFSVLTVLFAPSLIYAVNKIRKDCFSRPRWFLQFHRRVFMDFWLTLVLGKDNRRAQNAFFRNVGVWLKDETSVDDVLVTVMFVIPLIVSLAIAVPQLSGIAFISIIIQASLFAGLSIVALWLLARYLHGVTRNNGEWFFFFLRFLLCLRMDYRPSFLNARIAVASLIFVAVGAFGLVGIIGCFAYVGVGQGFLYMLFVLLVWPSVSFNLLVYIKHVKAPKAGAVIVDGMGSPDNDVDEVYYEEEAKDAQPRNSRGSRPSLRAAIGAVVAQNREVVAGAAATDSAGPERQRSGDAPPAMQRQISSFHSIVRTAVWVRQSSERRKEMYEKHRVRFFCFNFLQFQHAKVFVVVLALFAIFLFLILSRESDQTRSTSDSVVSQPDAFNVTNLGEDFRFRYPLCGLQFGNVPTSAPGGVTVLDLALFSELSYTRAAIYEDRFSSFFNQSVWTDIDRNDPEDSVVYIVFRNTVTNVTVVSVRGTVSTLDAAANAVLLYDTFLVQIVPPISVLPNRVINNIVNLVSYTDRLLFPSTEVYSTPLRNKVEELAAQGRVILTGHSLGGFLAKLTASQVGVQAITFASPGIAWSLDKFELDSKIVQQSLTNVVADEDVVARLGDQMGSTHQLSCSYKATDCHRLVNYICSVYDSCGDVESRKAVSEICRDWRLFRKNL